MEGETPRRPGTQTPAARRQNSVQGDSLVGKAQPIDFEEKKLQNWILLVRLGVGGCVGFKGVGPSSNTLFIAQNW